MPQEHQVPPDDAHPADMPRRDWLRLQLQDLDIQTMLMEQAGSWQALVAARRLSMSYRNELDDLEKEDEPDAAPETLEDVVKLMLAFPDEAWAHPLVLARVLDAFERLTQKPAGIVARIVQMVASWS